MVVVFIFPCFFPPFFRIAVDFRLLNQERSGAVDIFLLLSGPGGPGVQLSVFFRFPPFPLPRRLSLPIPPPRPDSFPTKAMGTFSTHVTPHSSLLLLIDSPTLVCFKDSSCFWLGQIVFSFCYV